MFDATIKRSLLIIGICICIAYPALAQDDVTIEANTFTITGSDKKVKAEGNVEIVQKSMKLIGDQASYTQDKKEIVIWDNVTFTYKNATITCKKLTFDSVKQIMYADGNVKYTYEDISGRSDTAVFYATEEKLVLKGNTEIQQGSDFIKGNEIIVFLKNKQIKTVGRTRIKLSPERIVK